MLTTDELSGPRGTAAVDHARCVHDGRQGRHGVHSPHIRVDRHVEHAAVKQLSARVGQRHGVVGWLRAGDGIGRECDTGVVHTECVHSAVGHGVASDVHSDARARTHSQQLTRHLQVARQTVTLGADVV